MRDVLQTCACGQSVWMRKQKGFLKAFENDRFGHKRLEHICSGGRSFAATIADDSADLFAACPWLSPPVKGGRDE